MKKTKFAAVAITASAMLFSLTYAASAEQYGVWGDLTYESSADSDTVSVTAEIHNDMFYKIDGIDYKVSVSDNAVVEGESSKSGVSLGAGETDSLSFEIKLAEKTPADTDTPQTEAPETEAPQTEAPETEAPETEAPETEAPSTEAPDAETPNPDTGVAADGAAIVLCLAAAGVCVWACAKKKTHILSLVLCAAIIGSAVTFAIPASAEEPTVGASGVITDDSNDGLPDTLTLEDNIEIATARM